MTNKQREWARQHLWFYCSDSRSIWTKDEKGRVHKFNTIKSLKQWLGEY